MVLTTPFIGGPLLLLAIFAYTREQSDRQDVQDVPDVCRGNCGCEENTVPIDGLCLPKKSLMEGCWVTAQCTSPNAICRRPSGRLLHALHHDLWQAFVAANQSERFVPGRCGCNDDSILRSVLGDELACTDRAIGGPCRSNYECGKRTRFSVCENKKCICISPAYQHDRASDQCTPTDSKIACENGSCPHPWFRGTYGELCFYGFTASMSLVLAFWLTFCFCSPSITSPYEPVLFTGLLPPDFADHPADHPADQPSDDEPPSYEVAVLIQDPDHD